MDVEVYDEETGKVKVHSQSGNTYGVKLDEGSCTCVDHAIRGVDCKHILKAKLELGWEL